MVRDLSVKCNTKKYDLFSIYVGIMVLVYPVGIPSLYGTLLFQQQHILKDKDYMAMEEKEGYPTVGHLLFLVESYREEWYYFGAPDLCSLITCSCLLCAAP